MQKVLITVFVAAAISGAALAQSASTQTSTSAQSSGAVNGSASNTTGASADRSGAQVNSNSASANNSAASANTSAAQSATLNAVLTKSVDSKKMKQGDEVFAKTTADTATSAGTRIPRNSKLVGHVTEAKAKGKGEAQSSLGFVFDKAVLKNGQEIPLHAVIQAVAAPVQMPVNAASDMDSNSDMSMSGPSRAGGGMGSPAGGNGGLLGGAANTVNNTASSVGGVTQNTTGAVNNTLGATGSVAGNAGQNAAIAGNGALASNASGVIGMKNIQLQNATSAAAGATSSVAAPGAGAAPVLVSSANNVRLDSGTQLVLKSAGDSASSASPDSTDKRTGPDKSGPRTK